jgi:gustatory receptor
MSLLLPHCMLPVASWRHGAEVAIFKNMWTNYQLKYLKVTNMTIEFPILVRITWTLCFFSWGCSISIILSQFYLQPDFSLYHTFAYYHIIAMLNGFCSLWYINCTAFGIASRALSSQLKASLTSQKPAKKLQDLRILWDDLSSMMQQLGNTSNELI